MPSPNRNSRVDFLRGVAIILVLLLHFTLAFGIRNSPVTAVVGVSVARALLDNGNYGVTVFFVISGYLITSMSMSRWGTLDNIDLASFYLYRFARIVPVLILVLAIIVTLGCFGVPYFANTDDGHHLPATYFLIAVVSVLTFWHNVLMQSEGWFNYCLNIYWSLSVEEIFYLALPIVCVVLRRRWIFVILCLGLIIYAPVYRAAHIDNGLYWECGYAACFDAIALGCLTALLSRLWFPTGWRAGLLRLLSGVGIALTYLRGIDGHEVFGFTVIALLAAVYLLGSIENGPSSPTADRLTLPIRWLGQHSYELYLFHIVILGLMRNLFARGELWPVQWGLWLIVFGALSGLIADVVARYVSEPANSAIRRRFLRSHNSNRPGAALSSES